MRIVADTTIPFLKGVVEPSADVVYLSAKGFTPEAIKDADALIVRSIDKCTPHLLRDSKVKLITTATIGFDHIDTHYCEANGIAWRNAQVAMPRLWLSMSSLPFWYWRREREMQA